MYLTYERSGTILLGASGVHSVSPHYRELADLIRMSRLVNRVNPTTTMMLMVAIVSGAMGVYFHQTEY